MNVDPLAAPRTSSDLSRRLRWIEDRLKYLASSNSYLSNGSVAGGSVTINEILNQPSSGVNFFEDTATATADGGPVRVTLSYLPREHSEHVYWGGTYQPASEWTRAGLILTFTETHIKTGDIVTVEYAYDPTDTTAVPGPVITSPASGSTTTDDTPTIEGTGAAGRPLQVFVDGVSMGSTTIADDGTWSITTTSLSVGAHVVTATQTDVDTTTRSTSVAFSVVSASPATATLRGGTSGHYGSGSPPTTLALPAGTVVGDLIAVETNGAVTDARMTRIGSSDLWLGFATTTAALAVDMSAAPGGQWTIACITLITNAVSWTAGLTNTDTTMSAGDTLATPQVSGVAATICGIYSTHSVVDGNTALPTGYTTGATVGPGKKHARVDFWVTGSLGTSPAGPTSFGGGPGECDVVVVGLIGP